MESYKKAKQLTDEQLESLQEAICVQRTKYEELLDRRDRIVQKQEDQKEFNGTTNVKGTDMIKINVGGTKMCALRETLTVIKGSRLDILFSGRWEKRIVRDDEGNVFFDLNPRYFGRVIEYLYNFKIANQSENEQPPLPTFDDKDDQKEFDLYVAFFGLDNDKGETCERQSKAIDETVTEHTADDTEERANHYKHLIESFEQEKEEIRRFETNLNDMENELNQEEALISYFISTDSVPIGMTNPIRVWVQASTALLHM